MRRLVLVLLAVPCLAGAQSLKGSGQKLTQDNVHADRDKLSKIRNDSMLQRFVKAGLLVPIPDGRYGIIVDPRLEDDRRYCRPMTIRFLKRLGSKFEKKFHSSLQVNSCTRDIETQ